jgi:hypothetical protein
VTAATESVEELSTRNYDVNIYPNPTNNQLTVAATGTITSITISNILGQLVCNTNYNAEKVQINVSDLTQGIYFIKINCGSAGGKITRKFVKE